MKNAIIAFAIAAFLLIWPHMGLAGTDYIVLASSAHPIGIALIAAGILLVIAETLIISHGLLALSGTLFFIIGSVFVIQDANPALRLLWVNILASGLFISAGISVLCLYALHLYRHSKSHKFTLTGQKALVIDWNDTRKRVEIDGSFWNAQSLSGKDYTHGEWVTIHAQDKLTLLID